MSARTPLWGWLVAEAISLNVNMRRYISGLSVQDPNLNHYVQWWWNVPVSPMVVWVVGSLAFAGALVCARWFLQRRELPAPEREAVGAAEADVRAV